MGAMLSLAAGPHHVRNTNDDGERNDRRRGGLAVF